MNPIDSINGNENIAFDDEELEVDTTTASDIETQPIAWTWPPYLPRGTAVVVIGDGGNGKSFFTLAIAAAISRGLPLPGMEKALLPPSDVIVQNGENACYTAKNKIQTSSCKSYYSMRLL